MDRNHARRKAPEIHFAAGTNNLWNARCTPAVSTSSRAGDAELAAGVTADRKQAGQAYADATEIFNFPFVFFRAQISSIFFAQLLVRLQRGRRVLNACSKPWY